MINGQTEVNKSIRELAECVEFLYPISRKAGKATLIRHLYSPAVKKLTEKCGISHITSNTTISGQNTVRWIGWDTLCRLPLPYFKEYLSEMAFYNSKNNQS